MCLPLAIAASGSVQKGALQFDKAAQAQAEELTREAMIALVRDRDVDKARQALEKAAQQDPTSYAVAYNLGVLAARQERWNDAIAAFDRAKTLSVRSADSESAQRSSSAARRCLEMDSTPDGRQLRRYRQAVAQAERLLQSGQALDAIKTADAAVALSLVPWEAHLVAGLALLTRAQYAEARSRLALAARTGPQSSQQRIESVAAQAVSLETVAEKLSDLTQQSLSALQKGDGTGARKAFEESSALLPGSLDSASQVAILAALDGDRGRVEKALRPFASSKDPDVVYRARQLLASLRVSIAVARTEQVDPGGTLPGLPGANSERPAGLTTEQNAALLVARDFLAARLLPEAEAALALATKGETRAAEPQYLLGVVLARRGHYKEAEGHLLAAVQAALADAGYRDMLGQVKQAQGSWAAAVAVQGEAVRLAPTNPAYRNNLGMAYFGAGEYSKAEAAFKEATRLRSSDSTYWANLARAFVKQNKLREADAPYRKAGDLAPNDGWLMVEMAECALAQGKKDQARKLTDAAARMGLSGSAVLASLKSRIGN